MNHRLWILYVITMVIVACDKDESGSGVSASPAPRPFAEDQLIKSGGGSDRIHELSRDRASRQAADVKAAVMKLLAEVSLSTISEAEAVAQFSMLFQKYGSVALAESFVQAQMDRAPSSILTLSERVIADALVTSYLNGEFKGALGSALDVLNDVKARAELTSHICTRLSTKEQPSKALEDLLLNGVPANLHPVFYVGIVSMTSHQIGYQRTLEMIPNPRDGAFGATAVRSVANEWLLKDPEGASTYISDLESSELRTSLIYHMVRHLVDEGDYSRAEAWASTQDEDLQHKVLAYLAEIRNSRGE